MLRNLVLSYQNNYQNYLLCVCTVWGGGCVPWGMCGDQRAALWSWFTHPFCVGSWDQTQAMKLAQQSLNLPSVSPALVMFLSSGFSGLHSWPSAGYKLDIFVIFISLHPFQPSDLSAQTPYNASLVPFSLASQDSLSHHT